MLSAFDPLEMLASRPPLLDRFRVLGRVGLGGMSEVFLAREEIDGDPLRHVALKMVRPQPQGDLTPDMAAQLFAREARTLLALGDHPNLCHGHELLRVRGHLLISMEWIDGLPLHVLMRTLDVRGERIGMGEALALIAQAAAGLEHAHSARRADGTPLRLVHLDVSPSNLMVRYDGVVKVIDFGVARTACEPLLPCDRFVAGKFGYMAPERLRGGAPDLRSDVFALGVCLFELLTGTRLYRRGEPRARGEERVRSLHEHSPELPEELVAIVRRALSAEPAARFESAGELCAALEGCLVAARLPMGSRPLAQLMGRACPGDTRELKLEASTSLDRLYTPATDARPAPWPEPAAAPAQPPTHEPYTVTVAVRFPEAHSAFYGPSDSRPVRVQPRPVPAAPSFPPVAPGAPTAMLGTQPGRALAQSGRVKAAAFVATALLLVVVGSVQWSTRRDPGSTPLVGVAPQAQQVGAVLDAPAEPSHGRPGRQESSMLDAMRQSLGEDHGRDGGAPSNRQRPTRAASAPRLRGAAHPLLASPGF